VTWRAREDRARDWSPHEAIKEATSHSPLHRAAQLDQGSRRGAEEPIALGRAQTERRVVVTLDKDFGELAFRFACHAESDVILIRLDRKEPDNDNQVAIAALLSRARDRQSE